MALFDSRKNKALGSKIDKAKEKMSQLELTGKSTINIQIASMKAALVRKDYQTISNISRAILDLSEKIRKSKR